MHSALYRGWVRHRRYHPGPHHFRYALFMVYLDLAELDEVFSRSRWWSLERFNLASFRRGDFLGPTDRPLREAVLDRVEGATGRRPGGPIRLLTHLRYFGQIFNPVSFYYCFDAEDRRIEAIVAEITNTPWGERHAYVLSAAQAENSGKTRQWDFDKAFHVSPFMAMDRHYRWRFETPGERLVVHMDVLEDEKAEFDATLVLERQPITRSSLAGVLWRFPLLCTRVLLRIHVQALKLWLKRNPVHDHPGKRSSAS